MKNKTLVFGASLKSERASHRALHLLSEYKIPAYAYGLKEGNVAETNIETEKLNYEDIETISLYMNPKRLLEHWEYLINLNPKRIIFNPGTEDHDLILNAKERGIQTEIACTLVLLRTDQYRIN